jgi:DNA-binding transcriptional regulator YiaG
MYQPEQDSLTTFVQNAFATSGEHRDDDDARQTALKERAASASRWRAWLEQPHETPASLTGEQLREIREAVGLAPSALAELLGVHVADIERAESGASTFADGALRNFAGAARDALKVQGA